MSTLTLVTYTKNDDLPSCPCQVVIFTPTREKNVPAGVKVITTDVTDKYQLLDIVLKDDSIDTTHIAWCNIDLLPQVNENVINHLSDKIRYESSINTLFTDVFVVGPRDKMIKFLQLRNESIDMITLISQHYDLFDFYLNSLNNYVRLQDFDLALSYMQHMLDQRQYLYSAHVGQQFIIAVEDDEFTGSWDQFARLFLYYIKAQSHLNQNAARDLAQYFADLISKNEALREIIPPLVSLIQDYAPYIIPDIIKLFHPRLAICVMATAINDKYVNQIKACLNTWYLDAKTYNVTTKFFGGFMFYLHPDYIQLPGVGEDYKSAFAKQFYGLRWLYLNAPADYYLVIGTDNYVNIENVLALLIKYRNNKHNLYIGNHGFVAQAVAGTNFYFHSGGAGFILSHNCLSLIANNIDNIIAEWPLICAMSPPGMDMLPSCDVAIAYHLRKINVIPIQEPNFYACNYKGKMQGKDCCTIREIDKINVCHYMSIVDMYTYHYYLHKYDTQDCSLEYTVILSITSLPGFERFIKAIDKLVVIGGNYINEIYKLRRGKLEQTMIYESNVNYYDIVVNNPFNTTHFIYVNTLVDLNMLNHFIMGVDNHNGQLYGYRPKILSQLPNDVVEPSRLAVVTLCDYKYFDKVRRTIEDIRSRGKYWGDLILITIGFSPPQTFIDFYQITVKYFDQVNTDILVNKILQHPYTSGDGRELTKLAQWNKLYCFDTYFKAWDKIFYFDAGFRIFHDLSYFFSLNCDNSIVALDDAHPSGVNKFNCQLESSNTIALNELLSEVPNALTRSYFLNCFFAYDTHIITKETLPNLLEVMNKYPIWKTNEMGVMNFYFNCKLNIWKPLNINLHEGLQLLDWTERDGKSWKNYVSLKYPSTIGAGW